MRERIFFYNKIIEKVVDKLPNRSLFFGEGVFETFRYKSELPAYYSRHIERLYKGCDFLNIPVPKEAVIKKFIQSSVKKSQTTDAHVKVCIFSSGSNQYQDYSEGFLLALVIKEYIARIDEMTLCVSKETKNSNSTLNLHKTTNYIQNIISKREAIESGYDEALFLNERDYVAECTTHNIFWINDNNIFTPAVTNGLLPGITRSVILDICNDLGLEVFEAEFVVDQLQIADCIFLTNAISGIIRVKEFEGYSGGNGGEIYDKIEYNLLTRLKWN